MKPNYLVTIKRSSSSEAHRAEPILPCISSQSSKSTCFCDQWLPIQRWPIHIASHLKGSRSNSKLQPLGRDLYCWKHNDPSNMTILSVQRLATVRTLRHQIFSPELPLSRLIMVSGQSGMIKRVAPEKTGYKECSLWILAIGTHCFQSP